MEKETRILNVGCGDETYGTDFVDLYPTRKEVKKCDVDNEKLPYGDGVFDKVYSRTLFEHLANPMFFLNEVKRVLKKGGLMELITDNACYWAWSLPNKAHSTSSPGRDSKDKHYALFTDLHLRNYCELAGLKVLKIAYVTEATVWRISNVFRIMVDKVIQLTPFRKAGFMRLKVIAKKV